MPLDPRDEIDEELRFHVEERIRDYVAQGMSPDAARRAAEARLGNLDPVRRTCTTLLAADRAAEDRRTLVNVSWLDVKLGIRMLRKYPGLSAVAVIGMALAIAIGAGYFTVLGIFMDSTLPVDGGERVMMIETRTVSGPDAGDRDGVTPYDFGRFRAGLKSFTDLGAFREDRRNVITPDGRSTLVNVAAMTASGFGLMRVPPLLGRTLIEEDERPGAAPVLVIGYDEWRRRFDGDPRIVGASVHLDDLTCTIVGVMPEGFFFPIQYQYWAPLRLTAADEIFTPDAVPSLRVFGKVAQGTSLAEARAELATYAHDNIRPQAQPYTQAVAGLPGPEAEIEVRGLQYGVSLLLLIVAVNVAILVYARTATRIGEIVVRTALGASRSRVVAQLFVEALVLSGTAAVIGLTVDGIGFRMLREYSRRSPDMADRMPFWFGPGMTLTPATIAYVAGLAILAALVIGVLPALKATGRNVQSRLQQFSSRGSGLQLGRTWTALIVLQVAIAVAVLPGAIDKARDALRTGFRASAPQANDMLRGSLSLPRGAASPDAWQARMAARTAMLIERLQAEPEVAGVTFAQSFPGLERPVMMETEDGVSIDAASTAIAPDLLQLFDVRLLAGRGFTSADARPGAGTVIVDQAFANELAPGTNVVGRRMRAVRTSRDGTQERGPWVEIVGVVPAFARLFTAPDAFNTPRPRFYEAWAPGQTPATVVVRVKGGDPMRYADRFRAIAAAIDPTMKLEDLQGVAVWWRHDTQFFAMLAVAIVAVTASVLLLSAAGIYSMMSFTVARRRREIGIRAALGADARRVLVGVVGRAGPQIGAGIAVGLLAATALDAASGGQLMGGHAVVLLPSVVAIMLAVGLLAAIAPARRGLSIQPTEALRDE
jgi:predicted permease